MLPVGDSASTFLFNTIYTLADTSTRELSACSVIGKQNAV